MAFCLKMKSDYSFLSSTITFADAISYCKRNKSKYLSLIDNNLHGAVSFYNLCKENDIKPIIGVEINVNYKDKVFPICFIAKSDVGYKNISKLSSLANEYNTSYIDYKVLSLYASDVIVVLSSKDSYLSFLVNENNIFEANEYVDYLKSIYKDVYLGIYRYKSANEGKINELKEYCNQAGILSVACQIAIHKNENDTLILNLLDCIKKSIAANKDFLKDNTIIEAYLKNDEQLLIYYDKDELNNLMKLADSTNLVIKKVDYSLPLKKGFNPDEKLKELVNKALNDKNLINDEKYVNRVDYELSVICKMGFSNYYLIVADYVNYAKNNNIPVGPSRGSGGASLIAFLLNITTIDPLKYDLLFERFLNPSRSNYPDFDIDFSDIKREKVIEYVKEKYGHKKVAYISTFANFGVKSSIRDIARLLKTSNDDVDKICSVISNNAVSINHEYKNNEKFKSLLDIHKNYKTICSLASNIEGLKKQNGIHAAGIILSDENLDDIVPTLQNQDDSLVIQYDYADAEKIGLIKMDFLGLKNLTIIEYCIDKINNLYNKNYTIDNIKFDDESAYSLISSGETIGLFQLESQGMKNFILKLQPTCFDDIVALIALYRPGPMEMIDTYIERKHGKQFTYIDESLKDILSSTYGIIIYQEQIMQICQKVANFSYADADILRRAISKKNMALLKKEKEKFINGCINNNFSPSKANELFSLIEKFASYGFNKAHSVGYGKITSIMAFLKANYKTIFYEALLNVNNESNERRKQLFNEAKNNNIKILKPDVNNSSLYFKSTSDTILYGLANITSIKEHIANIIIKERNKASFADIYDFVIRMVNNEISLQVLYDLNYSGALDCFNVDRSILNANLNSLYQYGLMFKDCDYKVNTYQQYENIDTPLLIFDDKETDFIKKEYEMLNYYISKHPLREIKESKNEEFSDISNVIEDGVYNIIGKIIDINLYKNKDNKDVVSIKIEDDTSSIILRNYYNSNVIKQTYKKGNIVYITLSKKNTSNYINYIKKLEV